MTKNAYTFHSTSSSRRASSAACQPNRMLSSGRDDAYIQRITSTPMRSAASSNSIALPQLLCMGRPSSPNSVAYPNSALYGSWRRRTVDIASIA